MPPTKTKKISAKVRLPIRKTFTEVVCLGKNCKLGISPELCEIDCLKHGDVRHRFEDTYAEIDCEELANMLKPFLS